MVAIRQGWETLPAAGPAATAPASAAVTLHEVGCTAELRQVTELPDGRFDIVTVGRRRFRIADVSPASEPYLTAEVEWLPEPAGRRGAGRPARAAGAGRSSGSTWTLIRDRLAEVGEQLPDDPTVLSHLVAATAALTVDDRQRLLAEPDTATRLRSRAAAAHSRGGPAAPGAGGAGAAV